MAECGSRVGKGLVTYPCDLDKDHAGPCRAQENAPSVRQRRTWEADQAQQPAAVATMTHEVAPTRIIDVSHSTESDTLQQAKESLLAAVEQVEALMASRVTLSELLDEIEAGLPETAIHARSAASMLRAMLRA